MDCPNCGKKNSDDAPLCSSCGWVLCWKTTTPRASISIQDSVEAHDGVLRTIGKIYGIATAQILAGAVGGYICVATAAVVCDKFFAETFSVGIFSPLFFVGVIFLAASLGGSIGVCLFGFIADQMASPAIALCLSPIGMLIGVPGSIGLIRLLWPSIGFGSEVGFVEFMMFTIAFTPAVVGAALAAYVGFSLSRKY